MFVVYNTFIITFMHITLKCQRILQYIINKLLIVEKPIFSLAFIILVNDYGLADRLGPVRVLCRCIGSIAHRRCSSYYSLGNTLNSQKLTQVLEFRTCTYNYRVLSFIRFSSSSCGGSRWFRVRPLVDLLRLWHEYQINIIL